MKKIFYGTIALALSFFYLNTNIFAAEKNTYDRIIVFGDSYSDNGNDFKLSHGKYPNAVRYYQGRFSDGPVWVEYFAKKWRLGPDNPQQMINLAYGQAKVLRPTTIVAGHQTYPVPSFSEEISMYLKDHSHFNPTDLIIVFISTNDFFDWQGPQDRAFFKTIAAEEINQIVRLIAAGAKHIIVLNGRDVTYSPLAKKIALQNGHGSAAAAKLYLTKFRDGIQTYNQQLWQGLKDKKSVFIYDIYQFDQHIISRIQAGGVPYTLQNQHFVFKNASVGCYQNDQGDYEGIAGPVCDRPQDYFFFDRIHTTKYASAVLAEQVYQAFLQN